MNRIEKTFKALKQEKEKALIGFVMAGDPDIEISIKIVEGMSKAGLDILELGIPCSDPFLDGPTIERSSARARKNGIDPKIVIEMTGKIRKKTETPIILFSYFNPIKEYGAESFCTDAKKAGADAVLIADLPPRKSGSKAPFQERSEFPLIRLIPPNAKNRQMKQITKNASGFLYLISKSGKTGTPGLNVKTIKNNTIAIRTFSPVPVCVGFGISTPKQAEKVASVSDGVIVGSAFVKTIEKHDSNSDLVSIISEKVTAFKEAVNRNS